MMIVKVVTPKKKIKITVSRPPNLTVPWQILREMHHIEKRDGISVERQALTVLRRHCIEKKSKPAPIPKRWPLCFDPPPAQDPQ